MILDQYQSALRPFAVAASIAERLDQRQAFWSGVAQLPTPPSSNDAAALAVRIYVEGELAPHSADRAVRLMDQMLLDPASTWATLGLISVSDASVGQELTQALKDDLVEALNAYASAYLTSLANEITGEFAS